MNSLYDHDNNWLGGKIEIIFGGDYTSETPFSLRPARFIVHNDYNEDTIENDIALLQFAEDILGKAAQHGSNVRIDFKTLTGILVSMFPDFYIKFKIY